VSFIGKVAALCACALVFCAAPACAFNPCFDGRHYKPVEQRYTRGLLFKVEKCGQPASYVFGTTHLATTAVSNVAADAFAKLNEVQAAGFELSESEQEIVKQFGIYTKAPSGNANRLSARIGPVYFKKLIDILKKSELAKGGTVLPETMEGLRPWAAAVLLDSIDEAHGTVLDEKLRYTALRLKKPVFGMETTQEQIQVFADMPEALQIRMLKETIDHYPEMLQEKAELIKAYLSKNAKVIEALEEKTMAGGADAAMDAVLLDRLIIKRNHIMEQRLVPRLSQQSVMLSVGVAHLLGKEGILHLLEQDGYFITPLP
jgi:uncharacterized protein YbaP (TraB family)